LADTPGFNRPCLPADPAALGRLFPEIRQRLAVGVCRYKNCLHQGDPGCAVGSDWDRHPLYLSCLETALARGARERNFGTEMAGLKKRGSRWEPLLDQRLRQVSRRRQRQSEADDEA
jgi:ribosome biogenesis GTPase